MKRKSIITVLATILLLALTISAFAACGKKDDDKGTTTTDVHTHAFSAAWSKNETEHWHAATCEHSAEVKDKAAHSWNDGEITTAATTEAEGVKTFTCTVCGQTKTESVPKLTPAHEHTYATEWSKNETEHWYASTCGHEEAVKGKAPHNWDEGAITTPATCTVEGVKTYTCTDCGQTKTEAIEKVAHTPSEKWSYNLETHYHICSICKNPVEESRVEHDASYEDCGFCKICGFEQDEIVTLEENAYREFVATVDLEVNGSAYLKITLTDDKYGIEYWRIDVEATGGITEGSDYEMYVYDSNGNEVTGDLETGKTYYIVIIGMKNVNDVRIIVLDHNAM